MVNLGDCDYEKYKVGLNYENGRVYIELNKLEELWFQVDEVKGKNLSKDVLEEKALKLACEYLQINKDMLDLLNFQKYNLQGKKIQKQK